MPDPQCRRSRLDRRGMRSPVAAPTPTSARAAHAAAEPRSSPEARPTEWQAQSTSCIGSGQGDMGRARLLRSGRLAGRAHCRLTPGPRIRGARRTRRSCGARAAPLARGAPEALDLRSAVRAGSGNRTLGRSEFRSDVAAKTDARFLLMGPSPSELRTSLSAGWNRPEVRAAAMVADAPLVAPHEYPDRCSSSLPTAESGFHGHAWNPQRLASCRRPETGQGPSRARGAVLFRSAALW